MFSGPVSFSAFHSLLSNRPLAIDLLPFFLLDSHLFACPRRRFMLSPLHNGPLVCKIDPCRCPVSARGASSALRQRSWLSQAPRSSPLLKVCSIASTFSQNSLRSSPYLRKPLSALLFEPLASRAKKVDSSTEEALFRRHRPAGSADLGAIRGERPRRPRRSYRSHPPARIWPDRSRPSNPEEAVRTVSLMCCLFNSTV